MLELIQITNDPAFARRCDALEGFRLWVDLERHGKAERQAGRNTFISAHSLEDVGRIKAELRRCALMVRVNPMHDATPTEVDDALRQGAGQLMLPMFTARAQLDEFARIVDRRVPVVGLLETAGALESLDEWIGTRGLGEVYVGLNDLHMSLGLSFMFEPLALGLLDRVARTCAERKMRFGFGGIARLDEGLLPGRDVLAEHLRLGSRSVILSRTFHRGEPGENFEAEVHLLRDAERALASRSEGQVQADRARIGAVIERIAGQPRPAP